MAGAPVGNVVGIYYDGAAEVSEGDVIRTPTGRSYRVVANRVQARGRHIGRQHLRVLVIDPAEVSEDDTVHPLHWYSRS
jgi:hypothetical protein